MAVDLSGTAGADTVFLTSSQTNFTVDLAGGFDTLFLPNATNNTTIDNVEVVLGGTGIDNVTALSLPAGGNINLGTGVDQLKYGGTDFDLSSTVLQNTEKLVAGSASATTFTLDSADLAGVLSVVGSSGTDIVLAAGTNLDLGSATLTSIEVIKAGASADTTFRVNQADLASGGTVEGGAGSDSLQTKNASLDLTSTTLVSVETIRAGLASPTTFTVDSSDLVSGGFVLGNTASDTLVIKATTDFDVTSTTLNSVEVLRAGLSTATTFTVDGSDLASSGQVVGSSGADILAVQSTSVDLTSTALTSVEHIKAGASADTTFTIDQADLLSNGSVTGSSGTDTLVAKSVSLNLASTTLSDVEILQAGASAATTFTVNTADLASDGSVVGSSGNDTLQAGSTSLDLTSTTLSSIEILRGAAAATTLTVDSDDLVSGGSVIGGAGADTLKVASTAVDLSSTTLTTIERIQAGSSADTTFTVDSADLASGGSVFGSSGTDTIQATGTALNLASTTLSGVEIIAAGVSADTTFTVDTADLLSGGSVVGSTGNDTLQTATAAVDLSNTELTSVEILKAGKALTSFTVDQADLASDGSVVGSTGNDTLIFKDSAVDLTSTTLTSVEILKVGSSNTNGTTFIVDAADLVSGGQVVGASGTSVKDTLQVNGTSIDLSSTTLSAIDVLVAGNVADTKFTVNQADLYASGSVVGSSGMDTLVAADTQLNLSSTALTGVEVLQAGLSAATTFTVDSADLASDGSVVGSSGNDILVASSTGFDLTSTVLTSVEILKAGKTSATTFTVDAADLASGGSVQGSTGSDTLVVNDAAVDLSSTALSSVEHIKAGASADTTFTVDTADLASNGSVSGSTGTDTLTVSGTAINLASTTLTSVEVLQAGASAATTFTVNQADLASDGSVVGSTGDDTLVTSSTSLDLSSTELTSVEFLKAGGATATTFTVDAADLASGGSVFGVGAGTTIADTLVVKDAAIDLTSTTVSSIEILKAGTTADTTFTLDQADLNNLRTITGSSGKDTLLANGTGIDLSVVSLTNVEVIEAGASAATTFTVDANDLVSGGSVLGNAGDDILKAGGTALDLSSTTLSSVEVLQAGVSAATTFTVDAADLASGGSVIGSTGKDTLLVKDAAIDLTSTALTSVEILKAGVSADTTFTVDAADLASAGSVFGSTGKDTLQVNGTGIDLSSTTLSSIEVLVAGDVADTTFTVNQSDLASAGSVVGSSGTDTLVAADTQLNLSSTALTGVEVLQAGLSAATTFTVDTADLVSDGSVVGSSGNDVLVANGTALDLSSTVLTSVEILKAGKTSATTFTVDAADLASGGSVQGSTGSDTLVVNDAAVDLSSTALSSVEHIKAGASADTTFTVDTADLASNGSVSGSTGTDTLAVSGTAINLASTTLTSVEVLQAGASAATTFTVNQADLASDGSVVGSTGDDTLVTSSTSLDLSSTELTSVEFLKAGGATATTFTVDAADLASGGSVFGVGAGTTIADTLVVKDAAIDLTSTTVSSIEILKAGTTADTTFTLDQADLDGLRTITGSSGKDTLLANGTGIDLSVVSLTNVEVIEAGASAATTFTVDANDLVSGGSVLGNAGDDILKAGGTALDLSSTTLSSVEVLQAGKTSATTFTVDAADLASGGSVIGSTGSDTLLVKDSTIDLTSTALTSIEILKTSSTEGTTFTVDAADLVSGGSVIGTAGTSVKDTLQVNGTGIDLSSTTLSSIEVLVAGDVADTTFTVNQSDLASAGSVVGSSGMDTLVAADTQLNLSSTALTGVEVLQAGLSAATTFTVDSADLASDGSVVGSSGNDILVASSTGFDLTSTVLTSVEILKAGKTSATTFTVDAADLASGGSVQGSTGSDTLVVNDAAVDLSSTALSSVEHIKAGASADTTFTVDTADLASNGSVSGSTGTDTLTVSGTAINLASTTLTSVEVLQAGASAATTFTVNQADLASDGSVVGSTGDDTLVTSSTSLDLSSTELTSVEFLKAGGATATTFTVDAADLASGGSVFGVGAGTTIADTLVVKDAAIDLTSTTVSSIEILKAGTTADTTFTLDQADLNNLRTITGSSGKDTLLANGTGIDLSVVSLTNVEVIEAGASAATTFTVDANDLVSGGSVLGNAGDDILKAGGTALDLSSTTLSSVEVLQAGVSAATTFTVDAADLASGGSVIGSTGKDTLLVKDAAIDLTSTALTSVEILKAGVSADTTFTVDAADLASAGSVFGSTGKDTLQVNGTGIDLSSTTLSSIEVLVAGDVADTTFTVNQSDLASAGSVVGSSGTDTLVAADTQLNLSSTALTGVEVLQAGLSAATTFTVDTADLVSDGSVVGSSGNDVLVANGTALDLSSTVLTSVEILKAGKTSATTFTVDAADLASGGSVQGSTGSDTLVVNDAAVDLSSTALSSVEHIKAGASADTTFTVDTADLASNGSVSGSTGTDTLAVSGTAINLASTTLTSVEVLQAGASAATTFTVNQADLASDGSVVGSTGDDTLVTSSTSLDLSSTELTSVEFLKAGGATATTFTVDAADLASGGSVFGVGAGTTIADTLVVKDAAIDLTSTTVSSIEILKAGTTADTTFTLDQADLDGLRTITGSSGKDTLLANGTGIDLSVVSLTNVEVIEAGASAATTFTVDANDLVSDGSVLGNAGDDILKAGSTSLNLTSTTLSSVEVLQAGKTTSTTFTVNADDLASGGSVIGSAGTASASDVLLVADSTVDLTSTTLTSIEILKTSSTEGTTFTVDAADLVSGGQVIGTAGTSVKDTLQVNGTSIDLSSTTLSSIEVLVAGDVADTTFTVNQADLATAGSVLGSSGTDTLVAADTQLNLSSTALTGVEVLQAGLSAATTFTVDSADLASDGSVVGSSGNDILVASSTGFDLTSTVLTSVEILKAGKTSATTFTVDAADLASGGSVFGSTASDTLVVNDAAVDLSSTTLSSVEHIKAGASADTTFTVDTADLASAGSVSGSTGTDTLAVSGTAINLASTTLTSVEVLQAGASAATTFTVNQADLASDGSVVGSTGDDTLVTAGTELNLSSTELTSVEFLKAGGATATTFTVDAADLASGGSVFGVGAGTTIADTLVVKDAAIDLTSTTVSSIEILKAGTTADTTFTLDQADLNNLRTITGSSGKDTLLANGTGIDLSVVSLTNVEVIEAGASAATTFTVDANDLVSDGSVLGNAGDDILKAGGTALDLSSTTLSSVEVLQAGKTSATTFTVNADDLASGGSVIGSTGSDTLLVKDSTVDLTSTALTSIEILKTSSTEGTTFTVDAADLVSGGSVIGTAGTSVKDTLQVNGTGIDLSSTTLSSIEVLVAGDVADTTFTVNQSDLASAGSVVGSSGTDTLVAADTQLNLSSTALTGVEVLQAGLSAATTFTVDTADLVSDGSVVGSSGNDVLVANGTALDLSSTVLTSVEILKAGKTSATTFTVDAADLASGGSVQGNTGKDTLQVNDVAIDLSSTTLSSIDVLAAGATGDTTFTVDASDLASAGSVLGNAGIDTLKILATTSINLASTTLSSIEVLEAGVSAATTFTVNQNDLASDGSVVGSTGDDTLVSMTTTLDLSTTALTSVEVLKAGSALATTFTVDADDLASGGSVAGSTGIDTLIVKDAAIDLSSTALTSVEVLKAGVSADTTFTVDQADLAASGSVIGSAGTDTLVAMGTQLNLASTVLTSIEVLQAGSTSDTTFTVDTADLASAGSVLGSSGTDTLVAATTSVDLSSTTLTDIEVLKAGKTTSSTFTVDAADLASGGSVIGSAGTGSASDMLLVKDSTIDLTSTTLTSIEILKTSSTEGTTFTVDAADLVSGGQVIGTAGTSVKDTLQVNGTGINLSSTTLSSIEVLVAGDVADTTFTVNQSDLASAGSVLGSSGTDTLVAADTQLNLSSTALTGVEVLQAGLSAATTFTVDAADLVSDGSVVGSSGNDILVASSTGFDLTSTVLTSVEVLKAGKTSATTFTVDAADLASGGSVFGSTGSDTLVVTDAAIDLSSTTLSSVDILKAGTTGATTFTLDQADLASAGSVQGDAATDVLKAAGTQLNLASTTLTSIEVLEAGTSAATTFTVDTADLASDGSVLGSTGADTLAAGGTSLNLTSTVLTSVEILKAAKTTATTFTVDAADLASDGSVMGSSGNDTLTVVDAAVDLTSTTLTSVEILKAGVSADTTFTVDQADLASAGSVMGSTGADTLKVSGTQLHLGSTVLSSIEILEAGASAATTFVLDTADLASAGSVLGTANDDTIKAATTAIDLSSSTISSIEILQAGISAATTFTIDALDLASDGSVIGSTGNDTLAVRGTEIDLTSSTLTSIEILKAATTSSTTFTVDVADLVSGGSVMGSSGTDVLQVNDATIDLTSTSLTSVDVLRAGASADTTFTVDQGDLASGGFIIGNTGSDTLVANQTSIDLRSTTTVSIETLQAASAGTSSTVFTVNQEDLAFGGSVLGSANGADKLLAGGTQLDLSMTTLSGIEILASGTSATTFTIDDDGVGTAQGLSVAVQLTSSTSAADTFVFIAGYAQTYTNDGTIDDTTIDITNWNSTDTIDVSGLATNGVAIFQTAAANNTLLNALNGNAGPATLKEAVDAIAGNFDGTSNSVVTAFQYGADTYVLVDNGASGGGAGASDVLIKLTGTTSTNLLSSDFIVS